MTQRIRVLIALARPPVLLLLGMFAMTGLAVTGHAEDKPLTARVLLVVTGFLLTSVIVNDLADEAIDHINLAGNKSRPLVAGTSTRREFLAMAVGSAALALVAAASLGGRVLAVLVAGFVLSLSYSLRPVRLSDRGAVASLLLPAGYVAVPFLTGIFAVRDNLAASDLVLLAGLYIGFIGRILLKDFRDVRGDALFGKRTFLVRYGRQWTCAASAVCWVAGATALAGVVGVNAGLIASYALHVALALVLLRALSVDNGARRDERIISAVAITGRGMIVTVIAHMEMLTAGWSLVARGGALAALLVLTAGQAHAMVTRGPRKELIVPTEWSLQAEREPALDITH
ncbi:MAG: geranylgeranylglycerol-phosphate geranylgeranyltransferase [Actinomycetota bacterium]|jgi:4-hydroxybenzoate polyprenyltransferase